MSAGAELKGGDRLLSTLGAVPDQLRDEPAREAGQLLADRVAGAAPRKTGTLAKSVGYELTPTGFEVVATAPYAAIVEARTGWALATITARYDDAVDAYTQGATDVLATVQGV